MAQLNKHTKRKAECAVIVLAAGQGKRMRSQLPKVLHEIGGKPLLYHVLQAVKHSTPSASIGIVVGHGRNEIENYIKNEKDFQSLDIQLIHQSEQKGTGHAVRCAIRSEWGLNHIQNKCSFLVLPGDLPLISAKLVEELVKPLNKSEALRLLTCELSNPFGYGRVIRDGKSGSVLKIVEEKDANESQRSLKEVAVSIYLFNSEFIHKYIDVLTPSNAQGEYYLTDLIEEATKAKLEINTLVWQSEQDLRGVNDPWELSLANKVYVQRLIQRWAQNGVKFLDPMSNYIEERVTFSEGVTVFPGAILLGNTSVGKNSIIGAYSVLKNAQIGEGTNIKVGTVGEDCAVGPDVQMGPYAHLRPESQVASGAKIGNFVELKKTQIGENSSVAHLSYLGDAVVGKNVNIGCGFVTCNFDGRVIDGQRKHKTIIEDDVFLGSDCQTVAPVKVGKGAYVASGSTVTEDVPADALAIARTRQVNKPGYAKKLRAKK